LGKGGFAEVYLGKHLHLGTLAAMKVLRTHLASEDITPFRDEARLIARLTHPHIVRVLDFAVEDGTPFLVMEYAPGGTLHHRHPAGDRKSTRLNSSHQIISYAVFCLKKKNNK